MSFIFFPSSIKDLTGQKTRRPTVFLSQSPKSNREQRKNIEIHKITAYVLSKTTPMLNIKKDTSQKSLCVVEFSVQNDF